MSAHWTVEENSNYSDDLLSGWIIRYDPTPGGRKNEDGTTSYSMTAPALAVTSWIGDPEGAANEVARDLNEADTLRADNERLRSACREAQASLAMLTEPHVIRSTAVHVAWAQAVAAEMKCRQALSEPAQ